MRFRHTTHQVVSVSHEVFLSSQSPKGDQWSPEKLKMHLKKQGKRSPKRVRGHGQESSSKSAAFRRNRISVFRVSTSATVRASPSQSTVAGDARSSRDPGATALPAGGVNAGKPRAIAGVASRRQILAGLVAGVAGERPRSTAVGALPLHGLPRFGLGIFQEAVVGLGHINGRRFNPRGSLDSYSLSVRNHTPWHRNEHVPPSGRIERESHVFHN